MVVKNPPTGIKKVLGDWAKAKATQNTLNLQVDGTHSAPFM